MSGESKEASAATGSVESETGISAEPEKKGE